MNNFAVPAHPKLNEHNRRYLYHSESLNDVMNESEVSEEIIQDYRSSLEQLGKSDQIIDRDTDYATDYLFWMIFRQFIITFMIMANAIVND